jgi:alpha-beta hydrolase superfamily lysophospholipase
MQLLHTLTADGLKLPGFIFDGGSDTGLVLVHGMGGNFLENPYAQFLANDLSKNGIGFLYGHNRGYSLINDIRTTSKDANGWLTFRRTGRAYERFAECPHDVAAWLGEARKAGWKKIFIMGYSLGGPKLVYALPQLSGNDIKGIILLSPADMVGLGKKDPAYAALLAEAQKNMAAHEPRKLLGGTFWGEDTFLSAQTFLDLFAEGGPADVLPLYRRPMPLLQRITQPLLIVMGERDDIEIKTIADDIAALKAQATGAASVETHIVPGANHAYETHEQKLADILTGWIRRQA